MAVNDIVMGAAGASGPATFVEDVFSTWLYTGNGSTQTIANGIDLSGKGGLVWLKARSAAYGHGLWDTSRGSSDGNSRRLISNSTLPPTTTNEDWLTFNSNGFAVNFNAVGQLFTQSGVTYASWTFREQPKFFDIVTYTGNGGASQVINHNLGAVPGCMIIKRTDLGANWEVYHRSLGATKFIWLNSTAGEQTSSARWNDTSPTSTQFTVGSSDNVNASGGTYVAYLFAHNAGGFGATGTDNVISCGSFVTDGSGNATVNLGYEPQWIMIKASSGASNWTTIDNMRGFTATTGSSNNSARLFPNLSNAEGVNDTASPNATGFTTTGLTGGLTFIYIAIRRPMKTPTTGTQVFAPVTTTPSGATTVTTNFAVDLAINSPRSQTGNKTFWDRLRGSSTTAGQGLFSNLTNAEVSYSGNGIGLQSNTTIVDNFWNSLNGITTPVIYWNLRRAPGFFDVVCYTGTSVARTVEHNLTVVPELIIVKGRSSVNNWIVYSAPLGNTKGLVLNGTNAPITTINWWNNTTPTASVFTVGAADATNLAGATLVAYLFATVAGVSKVGSYTGTGATLNIDAGFTTGARFVMIKRTDSTGDWFIWDTARGMVAGTDPRTAFNSNATELNNNWVYTASSGFQIVTTDASVNASGGSYIYLAIA